MLADLRDGVPPWIDPVRAPAHRPRRVDVLGTVVEEEDPVAAHAGETLELRVDRRIGLGHAENVRGEVPVQAGDAGVFRRALPRAARVAVHETNPVRIVRVGEARGGDARPAESLDQLEGAGLLFLADGVVRALGLFRRVQTAERRRDAGRPVVVRDATGIEQDGEKPVTLGGSGTGGRVGCRETGRMARLRPALAESG